VLTKSQPSPKSNSDLFLQTNLCTFYPRHEGKEGGVKTACVDHSVVRKWRDTGQEQNGWEWQQCTKNTPSAEHWIAMDTSESIVDAR
jgi:hypothetical protein